MTEENILQLLTLITFLFIILIVKFNKRILVFNLLLFFFYSLYFYYGLYYQRSEGRALGWVVLIYLVTGLHLFFTICYLVYQFVRSRVRLKQISSKANKPNND